MVGRVAASLGDAVCIVWIHPLSVVKVSSIMPVRFRCSRRDFLRSASAGATLFAHGVWTSRPAAASQSPNEKLAVGCIGTANRASANINGVSSEHIVALCDLDHVYSRGVFERYPKAKRYRDFRRMFDKEANNFDALIIGTPDHTHTIILMAALKLGKHIYCAKPLTHTIGEARRVRRALLGARDIVTKSSVQSSGTEAARSTTESR